MKFRFRYSTYNVIKMLLAGLLAMALYLTRNITGIDG